MIQIQNGKYYRTRNGDVVGPVIVNPNSIWEVSVNGLNITWSEQGHYGFSYKPHPLDLIEEVSDTNEEVPDFFTQAIERIDALISAVDKMQEAIDRLKTTVTNINHTKQ